MGMFDYVECQLPLAGLPASFEPNFQTKSFAEPYLDTYRINHNGILEHEDYRIEDRSDPKAKGLMRFAGAMTRVPIGYSRVDFTGEVRFYDNNDATNEWFEYSCYFEHGVLTRGPIRITDR